MCVQILGFSRQSLVSTEYVLNTFRALPAAHRMGIRLIRYDPARDVARAINTYLEPTISASVQGSFYRSDTLAAVIIWKFHSQAEFRHILFHEVGHHVFTKVLDQNARNRWFYEIRPNEQKTVSEYACKNAHEDFAESYATWLGNRELLRCCPLRFSFFADSVFG